MTEDVVSRGDDRPPRRVGGLVAGAAALAVLAAGVAGALRSPEPDARSAPSPSASVSSGAGWTEYPPVSRDPFEVHVGAHRPRDGEAVGLTMDRGLPIFLVAKGGQVHAYEALGGPAHTRSLLGWCAKNGTLQDATGTYVYLDDVGPYGVPPLNVYPVRPSAGPSDHVDIGLAPLPPREDGVTLWSDERCTEAELDFPPLPGLARSPIAQRFAYVRVLGRYTVDTEGRRFCADLDGETCQSWTWRDHGPENALAAGDLAGRYSYHGEFLVRELPGLNALTVVLTPASRLDRKERVGVRVRVGWAESAYERGGEVHLRFNPFALSEASIGDDSPAGDPKVAREYRSLDDVHGGLVDYVLARDATVHLPRGLDGTTAEALVDYLETPRAYESPPLWLVFDKAGRVMRVVVDRGGVALATGG